MTTVWNFRVQLPQNQYPHVVWYDVPTHQDRGGKETQVIIKKLMFDDRPPERLITDSPNLITRFYLVTYKFFFVGCSENNVLVGLVAFQLLQDLPTTSKMYSQPCTFIYYSNVCCIAVISRALICFDIFTILLLYQIHIRTVMYVHHLITILHEFFIFVLDG